VDFHPFPTGFVLAQKQKNFAWQYYITAPIDNSKKKNAKPSRKEISTFIKSPITPLATIEQVKKD